MGHSRAEIITRLNLKERSAILGILNVTPDSFWSASRVPTRDQALRQAERLIQEGADFLDVGGESSRPGAAAVSVQEELDRVVPVVEELVARFSTPVSVDTAKPEVAHEALEAGAARINDIGGLRNLEMAQVVARARVPVVVMHMRGTPATMQERPEYEDCVSDLLQFFKERIQYARGRGIEQLILDPGLGFGKTAEHNWQILRRLSSFTALGYPVMLGSSRKSFLAQTGGAEELGAQDRLEGSLASCVWAASQGVRLFRVHDVRATRRALGFMEALWRS